LRSEVFFSVLCGPTTFPPSLAFSVPPFLPHDRFHNPHGRMLVGVNTAPTSCLRHPGGSSCFFLRTHVVPPLMKSLFFRGPEPFGVPPPTRPWRPHSPPISFFPLKPKSCPHLLPRRCSREISTAWCWNGDGPCFFLLDLSRSVLRVVTPLPFVCGSSHSPFFSGLGLSLASTVRKTV